MRIFRIQLHPNASDKFTHEQVKEILRKYNVIGVDVWDEVAESLGVYHKPLTQWDPEDFEKYDEIITHRRKSQKPDASESIFGKKLKNDFLSMREGDLVLVHHGSTPIALVQIIGPYFMSEDTNDVLWFRHRYPVKILGWYDEYKHILPNVNIPKSGTIQKLKEESMTPTYRFITLWKKEVLLLDKVKEILHLLKHNPNLILFGPPGTGKTYTARMVASVLVSGETFLLEGEIEPRINGKDLQAVLNENKDRWALVQFHPAYNYDDFVLGIEATASKADESGSHLQFQKVWRVLGEMCEKARQNSKKPFVLILDEINRANLPAVLGELIYALEYRGERVNVLYGEELVIPPNLYIIGTMNTADRSAGRVDYAIRRRFTFFPMPADPEQADPDYGRPLMEAVNVFIQKKVAPDYDPEDIQIGHTYFMSHRQGEEKRQELAYKFLYQVIPLLYEYIQDGLVRADLAEDPTSKGWKLPLGFNLASEQKEDKKDYVIRGGRLYDGNAPLRIEDLWFVKKDAE